MIPYIRSVGKDTISCDCDLAILDGSKPILLSLVDYAIKTRKVTADIITNDHNINLSIEDREDITFKKELNCSSYSEGEGYNFKSDRQGELTHTIIRNKKINEYIIDWDNIGIVNAVVNYLRNSHYIPVTTDMVSKIVDKYSDYTDGSYSIIKPLTVYTNNPLFKDVKAYSISIYWFKEELAKPQTETVSDVFNWDEIETFEDYIYSFIYPIKGKISETVKPLYNPKIVNQEIFSGIKKPYVGQIPLIQSAIEVLKRDRFVYIGAEMGVGKTMIGAKANHTYQKSIGKKAYITLIVAPAITLTQWKEEIEEAFDDKADIIIIKKTEDFIKWYRNKNINKPTYVLIGKETFKLSYATSPSYKKVKRVVEYKEMGRWNMVYTRKGIRDVLVCPDCGSALRNINRTTEDVFFEDSDFKKPNKGNYKCCECKSILWSATYNKTKKTSVIDYIHRKGIMFNSVILDEAHESNNSGSIIGNSTRTLLRNHTKKVIALSGTNNNGYASSLHNLFMALCPNKLITDECLDVKDFVKKYGTLQAVTQIKDERRSYYSRGKAEIKDSEFKEIEGINPIVFTKYLASNSIFATLDDLKDDLPPLVTTYVPVVATDSQVRASSNIFDEIKKVNAFNAKMYLDSVIKHYINNPFIWKQILVETEEKSNVIQPINLNIDVLPKEKELLKIVKSEYAENRKVWIYCDFNNGGQYLESETIIKRLKRLIEAEGLKVFMLSTSTSTYDRKEVIDKNKDKFDVFICNPRLVNVGINLVFCPTYIFFMPSYRVDVIFQSSRRGYRANSTMENRIYHMYYENTIENDIVKRFQRKLAESNAINGNFQVTIEDDDKIRTASQFSSKIAIK